MIFQKNLTLLNGNVVDKVKLINKVKIALIGKYVSLEMLIYPVGKALHHGAPV